MCSRYRCRELARVRQYLATRPTGEVEELTQSMQRLGLEETEEIIQFIQNNEQVRLYVEKLQAEHQDAVNTLKLKTDELESEKDKWAQYMEQYTKRQKENEQKTMEHLAEIERLREDNSQQQGQLREARAENERLKLEIEQLAKQAPPFMQSTEKPSTEETKGPSIEEQKEKKKQDILREMSDHWNDKTLEEFQWARENTTSILTQLANKLSNLQPLEDYVASFHVDDSGNVWFASLETPYDPKNLLGLLRRTLTSEKGLIPSVTIPSDTATLVELIQWLRNFSFSEITKAGGSGLRKLVEKRKTYDLQAIQLLDDSLLESLKSEKELSRGRVGVVVQREGDVYKYMRPFDAAFHTAEHNMTEIGLQNEFEEELFNLQKINEFLRKNGQCFMPYTEILQSQNGEYILKMPFVEGVTLESILKGDLLKKRGKAAVESDELFAKIFGRILQCVGLLHGIGAHGDLNPRNFIIKLTEDDKFEDLKIIDFGTFVRTEDPKYQEHLQKDRNAIAQYMNDYKSGLVASGDDVTTMMGKLKQKFGKYFTPLESGKVGT